MSGASELIESDELDESLSEPNDSDIVLLSPVVLLSESR